jgi:hypothetical protein
LIDLSLHGMTSFLKRLMAIIIILLAALFVWIDAGNWEPRRILGRIVWSGEIPAAELASGWDKVCATGPYGSGFLQPEVQIDGTGLAFFSGERLVHFIGFKRIIEKPWGRDSCLPASSAPVLQRLMRHSEITNQTEPLLFLRPRSDLLDDLPSSNMEGEFQNRVEALSLSVSNPSEFFLKLNRIGFSVDPEQHHAFLETANNICHFVHNITWSVDAMGDVSDIRARRIPLCL